MFKEHKKGIRKENIFILTFFCLLSIPIYSQNINDAGLISRLAVGSFVDNAFKKEVKNNKYVVFAVRDKSFLLTIKREDSFVEYYFDTANKEQKVNEAIYKSNNKLLEKMFDTSNYEQDYITFHSDFFKSGQEIASGNITYFVLKDETSKKYGEARLSIFIKPNPIPTDVYLHLVNRIIEYTK